MKSFIDIAILPTLDKLVELSKEMKLNYKDKYSTKTDKYSIKQDKYSKHEDKYSLKEDKYGQKKDIYSKEEDEYSIKFQKICDKINKLLKDKEFIRKSELNLSRRTWENLIKRKEFINNYINKHGKILKK